MNMSLSTQDAATLSRFRTALSDIVSKIATGIVISDEHGIVVQPDTPPEQVKLAAQKMHNISFINAEQRRLIDRYLGQLIVNYAALNNKDWSEAISELELTDSTGKAFKTLYKLPRIVSILPDEVYTLPGLTTSHYDAATSFAGPADLSLMEAFNAKRLTILKEASENPVERGKTWVIEQMRQLQRDFNIDPSRRTPVGDIRKAFEVCSQALLEWTEVDFDTFGVTRGELIDRWRGYRDELIERGILSDNSSDPLNFTLPWRSPCHESTTKTIEAEVADNPPEAEQKEAA